ncbi:Lrp/AsnC family transcriptional regulator [Paenibacillus radicis (ex Gao et al. 2016)]|uniref:AsnC family transcriptional regulator n=1 Tax=Paenibacillus radicis (ex Gao et al. 2016) TaxID=1737354 RepID=A0A917GPQ4_9BACL|nr:Lrp/AsnC family transcriptional regulator [Paenibacillus radicis (ex Gao et al. 2016)]GGG53695.1 AsnC family transcriptional regulator [Paenibacillus radicis (ex Gao et al. 2016)]
MDQIDSKILNLMHENARIPISEMSRLIAMSQPAVTERVRKLEEQGIITAYRAQLSPSKLGKNTTAFVLFKTGSCNDFAAFGEASPEIIDLYRISGEYNFLMKVVTETTQTLAAFLDSCNVYGFSTTLIVLSTAFEDKSLVIDQHS